MKKEFLRIALQNVLRHWRKSLITGTCISLGFTGIVLLGGYMVRMERYLTTQGIYLNHVGHVAIYKKNGIERHLVEPYEHSFSESEQARIMQDLATRTEVEKVGRFIHGQGLITNGCKSFPFLTWGSEPEIQHYMRSHPMVMERIPLLTKLKKGKGFWQSDAQGIVITRRLSELLNKPLFDGHPVENVEQRDAIVENCLDEKTISGISSHAGVQLLGNAFEGGLAAADATIGGHYTTGFAFSEDSSILMPLQLAQSFFGTSNISSFGIFLKDAADTSSIKSWVEDQSKKWNLNLDVYTYKDAKVNPFYVGAMRFVYIMNLFFFIIVCGVVVLSLFNAIQIAILERKSEIGTLCAVGWRRSHVRNLFEIESLVLAAISLIAGLILSWVLAQFVNSLGIPFDIVGNAEKLYLVLEVVWWYCVGLIIFFCLLVYGSTSIICRKHLNVPVMKLLERAD